MTHHLFKSGRAALGGLVLSCVIALSPACAKTAATVDGMEISEDDLALGLEELSASLPQADDEQKRQYVLDYLIDTKLVAKAAAQEKLDAGEDFKRRMAFQHDKLLMERYLTAQGDKAVTEPAMRAFYDETVKKLKPEVEVRARHVLVDSEDEAKAALARVKGGEDFAKVAAELSKDPGSGKDGGDLGFFTQDRMVKEFGDRAFSMKPGEVSDPVKTQFGWHVIKLEERRERPVPPFEQVKDQLQRYLQQKSQQDAVLKLRESAKIERAAASAPPAPAPASPAPAAPKP